MHHLHFSLGIPNMKRYRWHIEVGLALILSSALFFVIQLFVFHRPHDTLFYLLQDFAFTPIQVLIVTVVLNELLKQRERGMLRHKMNMVIGAFFSEMGNELLRKMLAFDTQAEEARERIRVSASWTDADFTKARNFAGERKYTVACSSDNLKDMSCFLSENRGFMLGLLENPNLLERESFTELLWAVSHLAEELHFRSDLVNLSDPDRAHIASDISRAYSALLTEWVMYIEHLKDQYPYIFSLVVRTNPLNPNPRAEID
jgi:hypothetical protein